jgi:hypothetical protein
MTAITKMGKKGSIGGLGKIGKIYRYRKTNQYVHCMSGETCEHVHYPPRMRHSFSMNVRHTISALRPLTPSSFFDTRQTVVDDPTGKRCQCHVGNSAALLRSHPSSASHKNVPPTGGQTTSRNIGGSAAPSAALLSLSVASLSPAGHHALSRGPRTFKNGGSEAYSAFCSSWVLSGKTKSAPEVISILDTDSDKDTNDDEDEVPVFPTDQFPADQFPADQFPTNQFPTDQFPTGHGRHVAATNHSFAQSTS